MLINDSNAENFSWSNEAENVISLFYDADIMVYVEGEDDIAFWEIIFKKNGRFNVEVQDVGGCEALQPYIEKITSGEINAIVARDSDLNHFSDNIVKHTNIIYTKGYSIENTIIDEKTISHILKNTGRFCTKKMQEIDVENWLSNFYSNIENLIILDIHNHLNKLGCSVIGDSCDRFMQSRNSYNICKEKIDEYINRLPESFTTNGLAEKNNIQFPENTSINHWVKGHFLFSASLRFITNFLASINKKTSISKDSFYANILSAFEIFYTEEHADYSYYNQKIGAIT
ncbi:TPA: DUF4435 domain-containing protein [Escherichia coli]|nr:DUF4435 domain-containing protein [Escherichia coli]EIA0747561.1 DUF4435 domain-containing protein [Escherichia coli]EIY2172215.1 DUF4435 domain-containing protein [Escherichia coli]HDZ4061019.1 DUF4435 domain-containing protein [Escherichia coli]